MVFVLRDFEVSKNYQSQMSGWLDECVTLVVYGSKFTAKVCYTTFFGRFTMYLEQVFTAWPARA